MRTLLLICVALTSAIAAGCGKSRPVLAGGKPVSHWVEALRNPDAKVRKEAAQKLGNVGASDPDVTPALITALQDADAGVRCETILALVKCGSAAREAIPALEELRRRDPSERVRAYATQALAKLQSEP